MKTKLSVAAMALLLASCSSNDNDLLPENPVNATPIQVSQSVQGMVKTRAAVAEGSSVTATVLMHDGTASDWTGFTAVAKNVLDASNNTLTTRATVSNATFTVGSGAVKLGLNPTLYYDVTDKTKNSFLAAVSPAGEVNGTVVTLLQTDGQQDVMYAPEAEAGNSNSVQTAALTFGHLTTQLNFAMKLQPADSEGEWTDKTVSLKSIEVQEAYRPVSVDAKSGDVVWDNVNSGTLPVPGISNNTLGKESVKVGVPVMIRPASKLTVCAIITVGGTDIPFHNVPVKDANDSSKDLTTEKGKAHLITLTVKEPKKASGATVVSATATVTPWKSGAAGSADLE